MFVAIIFFLLTVGALEVRADAPTVGLEQGK
jgi:hypothetical protein